MREAEIKLEYSSDSIQCRTCLSMGRKLYPLVLYVDIFKGLFPQYQYWQDADYIEKAQICWECRGMLLKMVAFQNRVLKATEILQMGQACIFGTLSNLVTVYNDDCSTDTNYITATNPTMIDNTNPEIKDLKEDTGDISDGISNIDDTIDNVDGTIHTVLESDIKEKPESKIKGKKSKLVQEQVLLDKKPKFKIIHNYKNIFRKVEISQDELISFLAKERDSKWYNASKSKCESCVLPFKNKVNLKAHVNRCHIQTIGPYTCDICESHTSKKSKLRKHISDHYFKYVCVLCAFSAYHRQHANSHRRKHRQVFQCVKCEIIFGGRREFFRHFKQWHEKYICDLCGISFKMRHSIEAHIRKLHSPHKCKQCNKTFNRRKGLWLHNKVHNRKEHQAAYCVECDRWYADMYQYRRHLSNSLRHVPREMLKYPCPGCDKIFTKKIHMKHHNDFVHLKKYNYRCEECDKNFLRNCKLVNHRKRVHEGIVPPKDKICYFCGRGFATKKILKNHIRTHTGERPYVCQRCPAAFAQRTPLATHIRAIHGSARDQRRVGRSVKRQN